MRLLMPMPILMLSLMLMGTAMVQHLKQEMHVCDGCFRLEIQVKKTQVTAFESNVQSVISNGNPE